MKLQTIFDLIQDAQDILSFFDRVTTPDQLVSRLDRLKRQAPEDFAECLDSLRFSVSAALEENLELGGPLASDDDEADDIFAGIDIPDGDEQENGSSETPAENPDQSQSSSPDTPPSTTETK